MQYARVIDAAEADEIRSQINYDPVAGTFTHKISKIGRLGKIAIGDPVTMKPDKSGYLRICIRGQVYKAHRLAWLLAFGDCPSDMQIDHIDHDKQNNSISNLRLVSASENQRNRPRSKNNRSTITGVCFSESKNKWMAYYCRKIIGMFDTEGAAVEARFKANKAHGFHANHGI